MEEAPDEAAASSAPRCRIFLPSFLPCNAETRTNGAARRGRPAPTATTPARRSGATGAHHPPAQASRAFERSPCHMRLSGHRAALRPPRPPTRTAPMSLWRYANPAEFMRVSGAALPALTALTAATLALGLGWGFFATPDDYQQGATVKILFVHVPAALMAINAWLMMLVASLIWFVRRHHVSALAARAAAPVGATMTLIAHRHRRDLGPADVGHLVGLGPAADLLLRALPLLPRLHRALGGGRRSRHGRRPHRDPLPRRLGLRAPVALRRLLLEPGAAPGSVAVARRPGERRRRLLVAAPRLDRRLRAALRQRWCSCGPAPRSAPAGCARSRRRRRARDARARPLRRDGARRLRRHRGAARGPRRGQPLAVRAGPPPPRRPRVPGGPSHGR